MTTLSTPEKTMPEPLTLPPIPRCTTPEQQAYLDAVVELAERDGCGPMHRYHAATVILTRSIAELGPTRRLEYLARVVNEALAPHGGFLKLVEIGFRSDKEK